jgi:hypothetical protein
MTSMVVPVSNMLLAAVCLGDDVMYINVVYVRNSNYGISCSC